MAPYDDTRQLLNGVHVSEGEIKNVTIDNLQSLMPNPKVEQESHELPDRLAGEEDNANRPWAPIAVVGMAMRFPGGVKSPDTLWDFLMSKKDGNIEVPGSRYSVDTFYHPSNPHTVRTRHGYFLQQDPGHFDAEFFSITPLEAARMDPQQRILLEVVWECLENAGQTGWTGKDIGCYVGVFGEDWIELTTKEGRVDRYHALGAGQYALSNRISYVFDFRGPRWAYTLLYLL